MKSLRHTFIVLAIALGFSAMPPLFSAEPPTVSTTPLPGAVAKGTDPEIVGEEKAVLTPAPNVPPPIQRRHATKVVVNLEVREVVKRLADGVAKSDYLMADKERSIRGIIKGQSGEMTVNGVKYNGVMPPVMLTDEQIAHVLTFVRNTWGNTGDMVTVEEVQRVHAESVKQ